ncbi:hypothetical protein EON82_26735 [bacterium]|nr:MAG: hypothetical protein EON82_26735 [bacterium]
MPRKHHLTPARLREMRERFRFGGEALSALTGEFGYGHPASVRNAVLYYEKGRGLKPEEREGAQDGEPTKAQPAYTNP